MFGPTRRVLTVGILLAISLIAFEAMAVATAMPLVARDIRGIEHYGWAFSAFMLGNLVGTVAAGESADCHGPLRPFLLASGCFGVGLLLAASATAWPIFVVARLVQGLGGGAIFTLGYVGIQRGYPERLRSRMMALLSSAWMVPALVGPAVAGFIAERWGWRWVFAGLLPLLCLAVVLVASPYRQLGAPVAAIRTTRRVSDAVRLAAGCALVLMSLGRLPHPLAGAALLCGGIVLAASPLRRLLPRGTFRLRRGLPAAIALRSQVTYAFFATEAFMPLALTTLHGASAAQAGLALTVSSLSWVAGSWLQARLDDRHGPVSRAPRALAGSLGLALGIVLVGLSIFDPNMPALAVVAAWALAGLGMGVTYPTTSVAALSTIADADAGAVSASMNLAEALAVALGTGLAGAALALGAQRGWEPRTQLGMAIAIAALPLPLFVLSAPRIR